MEKIRQKPIEKLKNILIVLLTLSMLVLASVYIGGSQFTNGRAAISAGDMPSEAAKAGTAKDNITPIYEKDLLAVSYAGIRYGKKGGGAYGNEAAAAALADFAIEHIHTMLASDSRLLSLTKDEIASLTGENYIYLSLACALPYQVIYALSGEYEGPAQSSDAVSADRVLITFDIDGMAKLYISDGEKFYTATKQSSVPLSEIATLAGDSRLADFTLTDNCTAISNASPNAPRISILSDVTLDSVQQSDILSCLGYNPETVPSTLSLDTAVSTVSPLGTLEINGNAISYTAASDNGISLRSFLPAAKSAADLGLYDILFASVNLAESIREIAPQKLGGTLSVHLDGIYQSGGVYTVVLGLSESGIGICGKDFPYFAKFTVREGRFESIDIRFSEIQKSGYMSILFPAGWNYDHAVKDAVVKSFKLIYNTDTLPAENLIPEWHYTVGEEAAT